MDLVDIHQINPQIVVELIYATKENFTSEIVYDFTDCYLIECAAIALDQVQKELEQMGLNLKVWDGFRPLSAQWKFWTLVPDERYVSDPRKGGRHTRGTAVDVTLIDQNGNELEMPSSFDDFTEKAHHSYMNCSSEAIKNREILRTVMEKHGFEPLATEWWHYDFKGWQTFPVQE